MDFEKMLKLTGVLHRIGVKVQEEFKRGAEQIFEQYRKYREAHAGFTLPKPEGNCVTYASDFIEIPVGNIIKESKTEKYWDKQYIIYISPGDPREKIRVNTYYIPQGEKVCICTHYDRGLCNTLEEYDKLSVEYIEEQVYGSWMDGAR